MPNVTMTIEEIRGLVMQAKLEEAIKATAALPAVQGDNDLKTTTTLFLSRYNQNARGVLMGTLDDDDARKERAKITAGLLSVLTSLEGSAGTTTPAPAVVSPTTTPAVTPAPSEPTSTFPPDDGITKILFLASNPSDTAKLQLSKEHSRISERLQKAPQPEKFPIRLQRAVTPSEFAEYLFLEKPDIVHFSGHGDRQAPDVQQVITQSRAGRPEAAAQSDESPADESGIFLMDEDKRNAHFVGTAFLERTFESMVKRQRIPIKAVVFNACHSSAQAEAISKVVPYVVGTSWSVGDSAAIAFASGFYFGVAQGLDIKSAVDFGINQALAFNEPEDRFLLYKDGVKVNW
ncbi:MAG: CHAT domain-containing protein [Bacteroidota bacterium]